MNPVRWRSKDFGPCGSVQKVSEKSVETSGSGLNSFVDELGPFVGSEIGRVSDPKVGRGNDRNQLQIPGCQQRSKNAPK